MWGDNMKKAFLFLFFLLVLMSSCDNTDTISEYEQKRVQWENKVNDFKQKHSDYVLLEDMQYELTYKIQEQVKDKNLFIEGDVVDIYIKNNAYFMSVDLEHRFDSIAIIEIDPSILEGNNYLSQYSEIAAIIEVCSIEKIDIFLSGSKDDDYVYISIDSYGDACVIKGKLIDLLSE